MFKKELQEQSYDVGLAWDELVHNDGDVPWADSDGEFSSAAPIAPNRYVGYPFTGGGGDIGPLDDVGPMGGIPTLDADPYSLLAAAVQDGASSSRGRPGLPALPSVFTSAESAEVPATTVRDATQPIPVPQRGSVSTASTTSSSEGSPIERLGNAMSALGMNRGRNTSTTPIQLTTTPDERWMSLVRPGEGIIFHSPVEVKSRRRRLTASILPIPVPQSKPKLRHLVLTTQRLVCVKLKKGGKISIKSEALLRSSTKQKEEKKETRPVMTDVVAKGQKNFIVMTVS